MIKITKASKREIKKFEEKEWRNVDIEHYGKPVEWIIEDFIFKATEKGKILGIIKGKLEARVVFIDTIIVAKDERRIGVGTKLIERVEEFTRKNNAHKIFFFTMEKWKASSFYKKLGYKKVGDLPKHYLKRDFVIYSKHM